MPRQLITSRAPLKHRHLHFVKSHILFDRHTIVAESRSDNEPWHCILIWCNQTFATLDEKIDHLIQYHYLEYCMICHSEFENRRARVVGDTQ